MSLAGIYIHIPFCRSRCSYCDFATGLHEPTQARRYVLNLSKEISAWQELEGTPEVDTVYFGGGTPSLLKAEELEQILESIFDRFSVSDAAEMTMEMNPGTVTPETLASYRKHGINRASFGAQTFDDRELARLGRSHSAAETRQTFRQLREAGFENVSFDLIAGLPGQNLDHWQRNLDEAFALRPEHLSFYLLEVHEGTPLAEHIRRGLQPPPDADVASEMYEVMLKRAEAEGYLHYEISNLCLPGFESRHNTKYWTGAPYFGFGCSAHSYDGKLRRWANERDISAYGSLVENGNSPIVEQRALGEHERKAEAVFLGMRLMRGFDLKRHEDRFGQDLQTEYRDDFRRFSEAGLIEFEGDMVKLTRAGALLSNEVFSAFV